MSANLVLIILGIVGIFLITQRWFWAIVLFFGGLASSFSVLASIVHWQILPAIGFFILSSFIWGLFALVTEGL
jgi:hypothetical protein